MITQAGIIKEIEKILVPDMRIDTTLSVIFLKKNKAYKLKRKIKNNFVDYSSLQKRREFCIKEFVINKRNSPGLYRAVIFAYRNSDGSLELAHDAEHNIYSPTEYMVEMNRFDEDLLLCNLAKNNMLTDDIGYFVAEKIAKMHNAAPTVDVGDYSEKFLKVVNIIIRQFLDSSYGVLPAASLSAVPEKLLSAFNNCRNVLRKRGSMGFIRECHGDLHLGNICIFEGSPCIFDAVEFNTEFTHIDTLYDLAFLNMDLYHHGLPGLAAKIADKYIADTCSDKKDFADLMPLYLGLRTIIRCSILAVSSKETLSKKSASTLKGESVKYYQETLSFLS